jgi:integrase/recombinase XerD
MTDFPCLVRSVARSGEARYRLGHPLVDRYLEFVSGRARPITLRAVAFDLKAFFTVVPKDPVAVAAADVFEFLAHQRGDRSVVRLADRESGLSARTIARRLSSVSGLYAYLVARGDTLVQVNPVPRGSAATAVERSGQSAGAGIVILARPADIHRRGMVQQFLLVQWVPLSTCHVRPGPWLLWRVAAPDDTVAAPPAGSA